MTRAKPKEQSPETFDQFVPDPRVKDEMGITSMSMWRHDRDPEWIALGWPPAIKVNGRNYRSRRQLEEFKARLIKRAIEERSKNTENKEAS